MASGGQTRVLTLYYELGRHISHLFGASILYTLSSAVANLATHSGGYVNGKLYGLGLTASVCWFVWVPLRAQQGAGTRNDSNAIR